jgi:hypothetical protein
MVVKHLWVVGLVGCVFVWMSFGLDCSVWMSFGLTGWEWIHVGEAQNPVFSL